MNNAFQEQLLKAGLVTNKQVKKAKKDGSKKLKQQRNQKLKAVDEDRLKAQQAAQEKVRHDRELNREKQQQIRKKEISAEINQLITGNCVVRDKSCDIAYNFEHGNKIKRIYINEAMKRRIMQGKTGIVRIEGRYELVPEVIVEKIRQRNAARVVLIDNKQAETDEADPYKDYQIPDDLMW